MAEDERWTPLEQAQTLPDGSTLWKNNIYTVCFMTGPYKHDPSRQQFHISIRRNDRGHLLDWRHMQLIKNQLAGPEEEAVEIFPAESRLLDSANQRHEFGVFGAHVPLGFDSGRDVGEIVGGKAYQRPFEIKPPDLVIVDGEKLNDLADRYQRGDPIPPEEYEKIKLDKKS